MLVGYSAFYDLTKPPRHNAVLKLTTGQGAVRDQQTLHAYHRGFKRFVAYFRPAENRTVAQALAQSVYSRFGREVAQSALEQNHFYRFGILGRPLHTRRVRAIFTAAHRKQEEIRQGNLDLIDRFIRNTADGTPAQLVLDRIGSRAQAHIAGRQSRGEPVDPNRICNLVEQALKSAGADGTHAIKGKELNDILNTIIDRELNDREAARSNDPPTQASGRDSSRESRQREPTPDHLSVGESIDMPVDLEGDAGAEPVQDQSDVGRFEPEPNAATGSPAEATGGQAPATGGSVEPLLESLYRATSNDLDILANTRDTEQISEAVGRIDFAIANTIFDAQSTRRRLLETAAVTPPAGKYYRDALETCWRLLLERCGQGIRANVARSINDHDRAGMESVYKEAQQDLDLLVGPVEGSKALQALIRIEGLIMREAGAARIPEFAGEATHEAYWQYLLERCSAQKAEAIATRVASPGSDLRAVAEGANWFRHVLPSTPEANRALAATGSNSDGNPANGFREEILAKMWSNFMNGLVGAAQTAFGETRFPRFADRAPSQLRNVEIDMLRDLGVWEATGESLRGQLVAERTSQPPAEDARDHSGSSFASIDSPLPERPPEWMTSRDALAARWMRRTDALQREPSPLQRQDAGSSSSGSADFEVFRPRQLVAEYMQQAIGQLRAGTDPRASLQQGVNKLQEMQPSPGDDTLSWANKVREMHLEYLLFALNSRKSAQPA